MLEKNRQNTLFTLSNKRKLKIHEFFKGKVELEKKIVKTLFANYQVNVCIM